ncbi:MAG: hypothetical protein JNL10_16280 [Verrucomicrobiales bacterium]|nr:hypothetical protein [Verrucomicrobiales bacterium]
MNAVRHWNCIDPGRRLLVAGCSVQVRPGRPDRDRDAGHTRGIPRIVAPDLREPGGFQQS